MRIPLPLSVGTGHARKSRIATMLSLWAFVILTVSIYFQPAVANAQAPASTGTLFAWGDDFGGRNVPPTNLQGIVAISAGGHHCLALRNDGTVIGWGPNYFGENSPPPGIGTVTAVAVGEGGYFSLFLQNDGKVFATGDGRNGQLSVPANLNDVVAIAAGNGHSLALRSDGTVVAWGGFGQSDFGQARVPTNLNQVVSIAAGYAHSMALRGDGTVVVWGNNTEGETNVPVGLDSIAAIAAGENHCLALRSNGTVVAWGDNSVGQTNVPPGLNDIRAIAGGGYHSVALRSNATAVAWGRNDYGQSTIPLGLTNIMAIDGGAAFTLALIRQDRPSIAVQPTSRSAVAGSTPSFQVTAYGAFPLNYQWRRNGVNIPGATTAMLTLNSVGAADSDCYSVVVANSFGSVESQSACLAVLADGANENQPARVTPVPPLPPTGANSLVLVTHGWQWTLLNPLGPPPQPWMVEMTNAIRQYLVANGNSSDWRLEPYYWLQEAWTFFPTTARRRASDIGTLIGKEMASQGWQRVHLIAHSAGAALIQAISEQLKLSANPPIVQQTFLDPFTGAFLEGRLHYGAGADWAEHYFVFSADTDIFSPALGVVPSSTAGKLRWAFNVDIGGALDAAIETPYVVGDGAANSTPRVHLASHGSPIDFYLRTIVGNAVPCADGYGFPLSIESGGSSQWATHPINNPPYPLCGTASLSQNEQPVRLDAKFNFATLPSDSSGAELFGTGARLTSAPPLQEDVKDIGLKAVNAETNAAGWLALGITITAAVNVIQFEADFSDTNSSDGLLTVYWNTNEVGTVDERVVETGLQRYRFVLPTVVSNGIYTLSFRLDSFAGVASSISVTNVSTGFLGLSEPARLQLSMQNGVPSLQLTATPNLTYLLQRSTNLLDWVPAALILNTNGTARFLDTTATNSTTRFYRAVLR